MHMQSNRACQTCRARRIKCDGAKPICQKCVKSHRTCVEADAAKQQLFAIHIENQYTTGEKRRPRGPRSSLVPMQPNFDLKTRAHAYYVQNHFQVFQDMPASSPVVDLVFSSLALSCRPAATEACKSYLRLLQHMQSRILHVNSGNPDADEIDAYLLAAHFMARYESFVQNHSDVADSEPLKSMKVWFHFDGAAAILKSWYDNRHRYNPTAAIKQTRRKLLKSSLLREQPLPRWLADGGLFGEEDIALEFDRFIIQLIDIHHKYLKLKQVSEDGQSIALEVDDVISESRRLDQDIQDWSTRLPNKWSYDKHILPETCNYSQDDFYSPTIFTCAKPGYTALWNEYHATRMLISYTRLRILDLVVPQPNFAYQSETLECLAQLNSSADSLASFIPSCLDRIRMRSHPTSTASVEISKEPFKPYLANLVVWPMSLASSLQKLQPAQQQWFRSGVFRISSTSSECLLAYAMSDYWSVL
ncbi:hypothetical protein POJ06DRAFT_284430 [Lipomyces tetrasporus]|uniref:Zn(2)-C6 fungal-type domain-containing protein n=1 Tax=Lipomyces tetrasporus TaxID=54092 RepID=A0AAD7QY59_9ASCO|nr:uncharacterized protein POJ06DRAFT_284430 [Lipomyces tetrasporus]KAJ8103595.1 hypothetical protein POJ06DRAFT_284430 [Lipomyces tetrasporus]